MFYYLKYLNDLAMVDNTEDGHGVRLKVLNTDTLIATCMNVEHHLDYRYVCSKLLSDQLNRAYEEHGLPMKAKYTDGEPYVKVRIIITLTL